MKVLLLIVSLICSLYTSAQTSKIQSYIEESNTVNHFLTDNEKENEKLDGLRLTHFNKFINHLTSSSFSNMRFNIYEISDTTISKLDKLEDAYSEAGLTEIYNFIRHTSVKEEIMQEDSILVFQEIKNNDEQRMTIKCERMTTTSFTNAIISLYHGDSYKIVIFPREDIDPKMIKSLENSFLGI